MVFYLLKHIIIGKLMVENNKNNCIIKDKVNLQKPQKACSICFFVYFKLLLLDQAKKDIIIIACTKKLNGRKSKV